MCRTFGVHFFGPPYTIQLLAHQAAVNDCNKEDYYYYYYYSERYKITV